MTSTAATPSQCDNNDVSYLSECVDMLSLWAIASVAIGIFLSIISYMVKKRRQEDMATPKQSYRCPNKQNSAALAAKIKAKLEFIQRNKDHYGYPGSKKGFIDEWRLKEFPSLLPPLEAYPSDQNQRPLDQSFEPEVYLDYAGSALPTRSQLVRIYEHSLTPNKSISYRTAGTRQSLTATGEACNTQILANPHSLGGGIASDRTWRLMQQSIHRVMKHFGVNNDRVGLNDQAENSHSNPSYRLVFTSGATESLRIIAEHFPWGCVKISSPVDQNMILKTVDSSGESHCRIRGGANTKQIKSVKIKSMLVYPRNSHTSVIGMRNIALTRGAQFHCLALDDLQNATSSWFQDLIEKSIEHEDQMFSSSALEHEEKKQTEMQETETTSYNETVHTIWVHNLLVLPVECNFGGDRFDWSKTVSAARASSTVTFLMYSTSNSEVIRICHKWHVLLDTAKAAATDEINLTSIVPGGPEFAIGSFYKMFGHPTGLGFLFIKNQTMLHDKCEMETRREAELIIETRNQPRHYFGGGSVDVVLPHIDFTVPRNTNKSFSDVNAFIESKHCNEEIIDFNPLNNGTQHFRGIIELMFGFQELDDLGGMSKISLHSNCLAAELVRRFNSLRHDTGVPLVCIYGQWKPDSSPDKECNGKSIGPTVAFNVYDQDGSIIGYDEIVRLANLNQPPIQLRTGCFCNPGACQDALMLADENVIANWRDGHVCGDRKGIVHGRPTGCIRASFGKDSLWEDMDALASFVEKMFASRASSLFQGINTVRTTASHFCIDSLYIFPIKSCHAQQVTCWPIECNTGKLLIDREFALIDTSGVAMRLSAFPKMSQIHPSIDISTNTMTVRAPQHRDLILNIEKSNECNVLQKDVEVCGILCSGSIFGGKEASDWFTSVLGVRCWLVRHTESKKKTGSYESPTTQKSYSNEAPLLLVSLQSINMLNYMIRNQGWGKQVEPRHFRPNIVVTSINAKNDSDNTDNHPEDNWEKIIISKKRGEVELLAVGKCARCQMVDIDPSSGMKGNTLRALAQYRRDRGKIYFGTFFSGTNNSTDKTSNVIWLEVGDEVRSVS